MATKKAKRVAKGVFRHDDGRFEIRLYTPQQSTICPTGTTLKQAIVAREQWEAERAAEPQARPVLTVASYAIDWTESRVRRLRASTRKSYVDCLELHILPEIGHMDCGDVRRSTVEALARSFSAKQKPNGDLYAHATVMTWWRTLGVFLRDMAADLETADPTVRVRAPKRRPGGYHQERETLSPRELGALLDAVADSSPNRFAEVMVLAFAGLRFGEIVALRWEDVDVANRTIHVRQSAARGEVNATKTDDPRRVIVPEAVIDAIQAHRRWLVERGRMSWLCFPSRAGGHRKYGTLRKTFAKASALAGITITVTPQVLRRTYNTMMLAAGVERSVLRSQIGHSSDEMTRRYASATAQQKQQAVAALESLVLGDDHG